VESEGVLSGFFRDDLVCGLDGYKVNCTLGVDCNGEQYLGVDSTVDCNRVQSALDWGDDNGLIGK